MVVGARSHRTVTAQKIVVLVNKSEVEHVPVLLPNTVVKNVLEMLHNPKNVNSKNVQVSSYLSKIMSIYKSITPSNFPIGGKDIQRF